MLPLAMKVIKELRPPASISAKTQVPHCQFLAPASLFSRAQCTRGGSVWHSQHSSRASSSWVVQSGASSYTHGFRARIVRAWGMCGTRIIHCAPLQVGRCSPAHRHPHATQGGNKLCECVLPRAASSRVIMSQYLSVFFGVDLRIIPPTVSRGSKTLSTYSTTSSALGLFPAGRILPLVALPSSESIPLETWLTDVDGVADPAIATMQSVPATTRTSLSHLTGAKAIGFTFRPPQCTGSRCFGRVVPASLTRSSCCRPDFKALSMRPRVPCTIISQLVCWALQIFRPHARIPMRSPFSSPANISPSPPAPPEPTASSWGGWLLLSILLCSEEGARAAREICDSFRNSRASSSS